MLGLEKLAHLVRETCAFGLRKLELLPSGSSKSREQGPQNRATQLLWSENRTLLTSFDAAPTQMLKFLPPKCATFLHPNAQLSPTPAFFAPVNRKQL